MPADRRNDIGSKVTGAVLTAAVLVIMGGTYYRANGAELKAQKNEVCISAIQATQKNTIKTLDRIEGNLEKIEAKL